MFEKLFQEIWSNRDNNIKLVYNQGVQELAEGNLSEAIRIFSEIAEQHESAAYNLGLIYLNGDNSITPDYALSRKYLQLADSLGHQRAKTTALVIGLNEETKFDTQEYMTLLSFSITQYVNGKQLGNLAYLIAYYIIHHILKTSTNEIYSLNRFLDYEVYCIRNFGNEEVMSLYNTSSLTKMDLCYQDDWENGETAVISDYLNNKVIPNIIALSNGKINFFEMGRLRLAAVNAVYEYYYK